MSCRRVTRAAAVLALLTVALGACGGGGGEVLSVTGTDDLRYEPDQLTAPTGQVTIELTAGDAVEHTVVIEDLGDRQVAAADAGSTTTGTVELEAGTYTFQCDVPGHRDAGDGGHPWSWSERRRPAPADALPDHVQLAVRILVPARRSWRWHPRNTDGKVSVGTTGDGSRSLDVRAGPAQRRGVA